MDEATTITRAEYVELAQRGHAGTALALGELGALIHWRDARPDWDRRFWAFKRGSITLREPINVR